MSSPRPTQSVVEPDAKQRADDFTSILAHRKEEEEQHGPAKMEEAQESVKRGRDIDGGGDGGGLGAEVEALLGGMDHFPDLLAELMSAPTQVLLPGGVNTDDASTLQAASGCSSEEALRLLDCLAVVQAAADALADPAEPEAAQEEPELEGEPEAGAEVKEPEQERAPEMEEASGGAMEGGGGVIANDGSEDEPRRSEAKPLTAKGNGGGKEVTAVMTAAVVGTGGAAVIVPSTAQLARQLGNLAALILDYPGLRSAAMARGAPTPLLRILLRHSERAAAANAALALAALAAGPPPHKTSLIAGGAMTGLLEALRGKTAAHASNEGEAPGVLANAANAVANLVNGHAAGGAAIAAGGGIGVVLQLLAVDQAVNVRTNAAGVLVQLTGLHEAYRAAIVAAGGVAALAAGLLRGPDAPACNAALVLYNLAGLTPPRLRPQMAAAEGPLSISQQLMLCMSGRNKSGSSDETVAASPNARVNASAILLELCKDPVSAPLLADLAIPAALASLAAGRLPLLPPAVAAGVEADVLSAGVEMLYPVPTVVRGNCLLCLMALARMGPSMQLELGRCGALGTLLELISQGQEPSMQVNAANAICALAAANADIHAALVSARCVPLMAGLLLEGGDAARANVCAVFVTMMRDVEARNQLQECGGLAALVRMTAAIMGERQASGVVGSSSADPGGVLCNAVGAIAEAAKHPDLRLGLMQIEFGESLGTLLHCMRDAPEPAQASQCYECMTSRPKGDGSTDPCLGPVNAAAALGHMCREQACALQLARQDGVAILQQPPAGAPEEVVTRKQLYDEEEDDLSTVITPPLPLGAF
ncbi:hypothetical protein TSOC_009008 [Tetrabaena socialis]|uniref:Uncharacterized protein n=1 Tax=Tetrabaena socialis TaxID=47790 RepID=A0A2J7ZX60_9CHLO|nr:hypothetical protein TSOC_009008 [Tetrabaena socialis]|eukprot:PNH04835.1 hypothetical protein TSOC_009008 [Tetrabaena socialis]